MESLAKSFVAEKMRAATRSRAAFELKGVVSPLTVLRVRSRDLNLIERQLRNKLTQMPNFFEDAPVVLDLSALDGGLKDLPLAALCHVLRSMGVVPVGASGVSDEDRAIVRGAGLGVIKAGPGRDREEPPEEEPRTGAPPAPVARRPDPHRPPMVVRQQVRGGQ